MHDFLIMGLLLRTLDSWRSLALEYLFWRGLFSSIAICSGASRTGLYVFIGRGMDLARLCSCVKGFNRNWFPTKAFFFAIYVCLSEALDLYIVCRVSSKASPYSWLEEQQKILWLDLIMLCKCWVSVFFSLFSFHF
jgi:hypothetical protein